MKFGKLTQSELEDVDFTLPEIPVQTLNILEHTSDHQLEIRFGATGWGTDEWKGVIYPEKLQKNKYLEHYTKSFDTIELNSTHYRIPKEETLIKWKDSTSDTFRFCPKVLQTISHSRALGTDTDRIARFCDAIALFEDKLGMSFMQLPPYWGLERLDTLKTFLDLWPSGFPLAIEVRHPSFFQSRENTNQYFDLLEKYGVSSVITDVAGARYLVHLRLVTPTIFVRWVGNAFHPTDYYRLDEWSQVLAQLAELGLKDAYFFPHQPDNIKSPETTDYLAKKIKSLSNDIYLKEISWTNKDNQLLLF